MECKSAHMSREVIDWQAHQLTIYGTVFLLRTAC